MQCENFRRIADSYLSDELMVETNHEVLKHLEVCHDCRRELAARREVRARLREALARDPHLQMQPDFARRLQAGLRATALQDAMERSFFAKYGLGVALAASLVVSGTVGFRAIQRRAAENLGGNTETPAAPFDRRAAQIARENLAKRAAGDHRDCAVAFRLAEDPIDLDDAGAAYDRAYIDLAKAAMSRQGGAPVGVDLLEAHSCVFEGQRFGHVVLRYNGQLVSLLVTTRSHGNEGPLHPDAEIPANDHIVAYSGVDEYQVACFETARHALFVVSRLPEAENLAFARAIASPVSDHVRRAERTA
jgi:hypothetical protein